MKFIDVSPEPRRIVGVVADLDDENVVPGPALTIYHPIQQVRAAGRLFVHAAGDPYALVPSVTRIVREMSPNQPVERAATLEDVRAEVLAPERLNAFVVAVFAGIALLIAVVGVAGVLAFSVSARTREFGVRLAVGSAPRHLLMRVLLEGALIVAVGILAGAAGGSAFAGVAAGYLDNMRLPGALPVLGAAIVLVGAGVLASLMPAARASRVDVLQALRSE
jgi:ABC-type antimicrobial peptide transport system permease subunit